MPSKTNLSQGKRVILSPLRNKLLLNNCFCRTWAWIRLNPVTEVRLSPIILVGVVERDGWWLWWSGTTFSCGCWVIARVSHWWRGVWKRGVCVCVCLGRGVDWVNEACWGALTGWMAGYSWQGPQGPTAQGPHGPLMRGASTKDGGPHWAKFQCKHSL